MCVYVHHKNSHQKRSISLSMLPITWSLYSISKSHKKFRERSIKTTGRKKAGASKNLGRSFPAIVVFKKSFLKMKLILPIQPYNPWRNSCALTPRSSQGQNDKTVSAYSFKILSHRNIRDPAKGSEFYQSETSSVNQLTMDQERTFSRIPETPPSLVTSFARQCSQRNWEP